MRSSDLDLLATPGLPALRGDLLLVGVTRPDLATDTCRGGLHRVSPDGGTSHWTHGPRDSAPAISPDGRWVAFLRAGDGTGAEAKPQLHVMPAGGGEPVRLTALPLGVDAPVWAADSTRLAFTARVPEPGRYGTPLEDEDEALEPAAEAPRRITRLDYRVDDLGFRLDRPKRLFVLDVPAALRAAETGERTDPAPLTDDRTDVHDPAWTRDGRHVVVVAERDWGRVETLHSDLYAVPAEGGDPVLAVRTAGTAAMPAVDADGTVWFFGAEFPGVDMAGRNTSLWAAELRLDGAPAEPRRLTEVESVDCAPSAGPPARRGDEVLVVVRHRGAEELRAVPCTAREAALDTLPLLAGERGVVRGFAVDGAAVAAVVATADSTGDVVLLDGQTRTVPRVLTDFSAPLRSAGLRPLEELTTESADGYPVHGWVVVPEGEGPHPVVLAVHGGPFAHYTWAVFDEAQVYASAGYAVVLTNPRGSAGYGQEHGRSIVRRLGTVDAGDVLAMLDAALARPDLDPARVGVMGGSYGGFMTGWLAAHHGERFRAAWSERAVNAWDSFTGSSDIGWEFTDSYVGTDPEEQRRRSPLTYADRIGIPFAVVHSEQDWRCPLEQAQRMFVALRLRGAPAELLLFPGEGHELSRSGRPRHRRQRFDAVLEWWDRHLGGTSSA
ncbi:Dipeptidyl aminopeptidase/acylaminoacyl peptidase [Amycolatopsis arida]|uniref:Dipeptidyl aminopeptidase/acylaminoacyl peptidase n=1 Tax=Amycolatopsis arida TaxID=587909 RepID=A0A1I6AFT1_9PSEU|nr:S9 family peptidase [Amycolatopsis arida]TDX97707.1 dipeptidyl aminopeptidase/acylaminoacyl peptidase [Amycolatopsis arida]SFQ67584.1 Dipeptidyl aminopeptidase/acylaminoacyl peptidase [Amycolatopsis arida]